MEHFQDIQAWAPWIGGIGLLVAFPPLRKAALWLLGLVLLVQAVFELLGNIWTDD